VDDDDDLDEAKADFQVLQGMLRKLRNGGVKKAGKAGPSLPVERLQQRGGPERKRLDVSRLTAASASGVTASRSVGRPDLRPPNFLSDLDTTETPTSEGCVESPPSVSDTSQAFPETNSVGLSSTSERVQESSQHRGSVSYTPGDYAQDSETMHLAAAPLQEALVPRTGLPFQGASVQSSASAMTVPRGVVLERESPSQSPGPILFAPGVELQSPGRGARVPGSAAREREEGVSWGTELAPSCGGVHPSGGGVNVPSEAAREGEVHRPGASETASCGGGVQAVGSGVNAPSEVGSGVNALSEEGGAVKVPSKVGNGVDSPGKSPRAQEGALQEVVRRMTEGTANNGQVAEDRGVDLSEEYSRNWTGCNGSFRGGGLVEKRGAWEREGRSAERGVERGAEGGGSRSWKKGGVRLDQDMEVAGPVEEQGRRQSAPQGRRETRPFGGALLEMGPRQKEPVSGVFKEVPNRRRASKQEAAPREEALLKAPIARSLRKSRPERQDRGLATEPVDESVISAVVSSIGALRKVDGGVTFGAVEGVLEPWAGRVSQAGWERVLEVLEGEGDWLGVMAVFGWMVGRHAGFDPEIEGALSTSDGKPETGRGVEPGEGAAVESISNSGFGSPLEGTNSKGERLLLDSGRGLGGEEGISNFEPGEAGASDSVSDRAFGSAPEGIHAGLGFGEGWRDATGVAISHLENGAHVKGHIESVTFEFDASDLVSGTAVGDLDGRSREFWGQIGLDADGSDGAVGDNACSCWLCASSRGSAAFADAAREGAVLSGFPGTEKGIAGVGPESERVRLERLANPGGLGVRTEPVRSRDPLRKRRNRKRSLLSTPVCATAVRVLGAAGCLPGVSGFLPLLDGTTAGHRLRKALITHLAREGRAEEALSLLLSSRQREILLYNVVMDACSKAWLGHERVVALFDLMALDGLEPSVRSFNIVLSALVRENMLVEASRWMDEMRVRGCKPDAVSYNTLLGARVQYKVARGIFDQMLREGVSPNLRTFNVLIAALAAIGDYVEAKTWVHRMKGMGVEPSQVRRVDLPLPSFFHLHGEI
jgi:pentatricopeptide repeat protein